MLMEFAVGVSTVLIALPLVYGMKKTADLVHYKRDNKVTWKESVEVNVTKWYDWPSVGIILLLSVVIVVAILSAIFAE